MPSVTYHVAVPFDRDDEGNLVPGEAKEWPNADRARRAARALAETHAGAVSFSRTGDPDSGVFEEGEIIAEFGAVDRGALQG